MDYFPDLMDPMEERDAFDLANEAWMYDEMTKDVITSEESISFEKGIELEL